MNLWSAADPDDEDFHECIAKRAQGDAQLVILYESEAPRLRRFFSRRLARRDEVQDFVHNAFARFLGMGTARRAALDEPRAYLTRIAENLVRDEARSAHARAAPRQISLQDATLLPANDPTPMIEARDMLGRVDAAISALPTRTREIFMAHRFEELTYPQIAARMGISVKTVEKHISLALLELHRSLGPIG